MNAPHVETLTYTVETTGPHTHDYGEAKALLHKVSGVGEFRIKDGILTVKPCIHCSNAQTARHLVEPHLRDWEIHNDLTGCYGALRFRFSGSSVIDRNPPEGSNRYGFSDQVAMADELAISIKPDKYPKPPPSTFLPTDVVRDAHSRWQQYKEGKEPIRAMAYYVLTRLDLEAKAVATTNKPRQTAALYFNISKKVLDKIGQISSMPGQGGSARKAGQDLDNPYVPHNANGEEIQRINSKLDAWLQDTMVKVILHLADAGNNQGSQLSMRDLNSLPQEV